VKRQPQAPARRLGWVWEMRGWRLSRWQRLFACFSECFEGLPAQAGGGVLVFLSTAHLVMSVHGALLVLLQLFTGQAFQCLQWK